jgi:hypothetical protein
MEQQLFTWESWNDLDSLAFSFIDCTLKVDIGPYKAGQKLFCVEMNYGNGIVCIYDEDGAGCGVPSYTCKMSLKLEE